MGRGKKDVLKQQIEKRRKARTIQDHADYQATVWIALHGTEKAETIAVLTVEKIRAQKRNGETK